MFFLIIGPKISINDDLKSDFYQRFYNSRPPVINIVISDGYRYRKDNLDSLYKSGYIIMPFEILLDEGPRVSYCPCTTIYIL